MINTSQIGYIVRLLWLALGMLVAVHIFGTIGYMLLTEGKYSWFDCFYMTFITVATIGFGEIIDMSSNQPARILTVAIGILGAGNLSMLFSIVTVALLETDLNGSLRRRRMEKAITKLRGHYVLCGFGRVGRNIAHELEATNRHFVGIDEDLHRLEEYKEKSLGFLYLNGDASDDDVLLAADLADAKGLFAVTGDDSRNLMIVITAKQLKPTIRVVARCQETRNTEKMRKAGADAIQVGTATFNDPTAPARVLDELTDLLVARGYAAFRDVVAAALLRAVRDVDYGNFKKTVTATWRERLYLGVWSLLWREQSARAPKPRKQPVVRLDLADAIRREDTAQRLGDLLDERAWPERWRSCSAIRMPITFSRWPS